MNKQSKLIAEIFLLAMRVQSETNYCVFIDYSGHVETMKIRIRRSKKKYHDTVAECEFNTVVKEYSSEENTIKRMECVKETLLEILENKEVDVSNLDYEVEEIRHYYF